MGENRKEVGVRGELWPARFPRLPQMRIKSCPRCNLVAPLGKGVAILSSGECPEPFSDIAFIRVGKGRGIQHMCIAYQSMSNKATVIKN